MVQAQAVRQLSYIQAVNEALRQEMERDDTVIVMGEDIAGGGDRPDKQDAWGGPMRLTKGLIGQFGPRRIRAAGEGAGRPGLRAQRRGEARLGRDPALPRRRRAARRQQPDPTPRFPRSGAGVRRRRRGGHLYTLRMLQRHMLLH